MKFGIRRSQSLIKEFDVFVANKNKERLDLIQKTLTENKSKEENPTMSIAKDDITQ